MRRYAVILTLALTSLAMSTTRAAEQTGSSEGLMAGLGMEATGVPSAVGLKGLWALDVSADGAMMTTRDLEPLFAKGSLTLEDQAPAFGFSVRLHRHLNDSFYLGAGFDSLAKSFKLYDTAMAEDNVIEWIGLFPSALAGLTFYRTEHAFFSAEAQAGLLTLNQSSWTVASGGGQFSGSAAGWVLTGSATWFVIPSVGLQASLGYRQGLIGDVTLTDSSGDKVDPSSGETFRVDFSGPLARLGISFFWGMENPWGDMHTSPPPPPPPSAAPSTSDKED